MALDVTTKDCTALSDSELAEMADICADGGICYEVGTLSKQVEQWVLVTLVHEGNLLRGFSFSTLERIGGTPCILLGVAAIKRTSKREPVLRAIIGDNFRRALMAFPDEDVLLGTRMSDAGALEAFKLLSDIVPRPDHKASGEERAWGRRLVKRFGIERGTLRRPDLHHRRRRVTASRARPRVPQAGVHPGRGRRAVRPPRRRPWRLPRDLRVGHGRGTAQARVTAPRTFESVLASRRMCRDFVPDPIESDDLDAVLAASLRGPAAGNTAASDLLVLVGADVDEYWSVTLPPQRRASFPWPGLLRAPVLVVPYVEPARYVERYAEPDKAASGLGAGEHAWEVPYWWVDGGASVMAMLLAAESRGLGALFFGQFSHEDAVRRRFGVPDGRRALGTLAFGHPAAGGSNTSRSARRGRPQLGDVRHDGAWNT